MLAAGDLAPLATPLQSVLLNGPAVLVFYKVSCPTCQLTLPFLQRIADHAVPGSPQLVVISQDNAKATQQFDQRFGLRLPTLLDTTQSRYEISNAFRISHVPSIFVVGSDGKIEHSFTGFVKTELEELGKRFGVDTFQPDEKVPLLRPG